MPLLATAVKDALVAQIVKELSNRREEIPIGHQDVWAVVDVIDFELNAAEGNILGAVSPGASTWLTANQKIAREIVTTVELTRKENL